MGTPVPPRRRSSARNGEVGPRYCPDAAQCISSSHKIELLVFRIKRPLLYRGRLQRKMAAAMNAMLTKYLKDFSVPESTALVETNILSSLAGSPLDDMGFFAEPEPAIDLEAE